MLVFVELFGSPFMKNCNVVIALLFGGATFTSCEIQLLTHSLKAPLVQPLKLACSERQLRLPKLCLKPSASKYSSGKWLCNAFTKLDLKWKPGVKVLLLSNATCTATLRNVYRYASANLSRACLRSASETCATSSWSTPRSSSR
jgi:hypothetical protein